MKVYEVQCYSEDRQLDYRVKYTDAVYDNLQAAVEHIRAKLELVKKAKCDGGSDVLDIHMHDPEDSRNMVLAYELGVTSVRPIEYYGLIKYYIIEHEVLAEFKKES